MKLVIVHCKHDEEADNCMYTCQPCCFFPAVNHCLSGDDDYDTKTQHSSTSQGHGFFSYLGNRISMALYWFLGSERVGVARGCVSHTIAGFA